MEIAGGIVLLVLGVVAWLGQTWSWLAPSSAERFGLTEAEEDVEPAFYADVRGEALWDAFTLWALPVAGLLLVIDSAAWAYFGLAGGAVYVYFGGRGILARLAMQWRGLRFSKPGETATAYVALAVWGIAGVLTVIAAVAALA